MKFVFDTQTTMKHYNFKKWWIDADIIPQIRLDADSLTAALEKFRDIVNSKYGVDISENALKDKEPMFVDDENGDPLQIGYVITGSSLFDRGDYSGYSKQYVDIWTTISALQPVEFTAAI